MHSFQEPPGLDAAPSQAVRRPRPVFRSLFIGGCVIVIIFASLLYIFTGYLPGQRTQATAAAQAHASSVSLTATSEYEGTVGAYYNYLTASAQDEAATVTYDTNMYYTIAVAPPSFVDAFAGPSSLNWVTDQVCSYESTGYKITTDTKSFSPCLAYGLPALHNFAFQVKMNIVKGGGGGFIFRVDPQAETYYVLTIDHSGRYDFYSAVTGEPNQVDNRFDGQADQLNTGYNVDNVITLVAKEDTFWLYINDQYIFKIQDSSLTQGFIGLVAYPDQTDPVSGSASVIYTSARIWQL